MDSLPYFKFEGTVQFVSSMRAVSGSSGSLCAGRAQGRYSRGRAGMHARLVIAEIVGIDIVICEDESGEETALVGAMGEAPAVLFMHFSMWPFSTSLRLNFRPQS